MKIQWQAAMTLAELISSFRDDGMGWRGSREIPRRVGRLLDAVIPAADRTREVHVTYLTGSDGSGTCFHYHYEWDVVGYNLPDGAEGSAPTDMVQAVFGSGGDVSIHNTPEVVRIAPDVEQFHIWATW